MKKLIKNIRAKVAQQVRWERFLIDVEKESTVREATRWLPDISRGLKKSSRPPRKDKRPDSWSGSLSKATGD